MRSQTLVLLRVAVPALSAFMVMACGSNTTNTNQPTPTPANETANTNAPATPASSANTANSSQQPTQATGRPDCGNCWVHIYDDKGFDVTDDNHLICGPGKWPNLRSLPGAAKINWGDEIQSLKVGPAATVVVWIGEQYTGMSQTFGPGSQKPNLKDVPNLSDNISSIEIKCQ